MRFLPSFILVLALAGSAAAQASFTPFGTGCSVAGLGAPAIGNIGLPKIGTTFTILYKGPNFTFNNGQQIMRPWLNLGLQQVMAAIPQGVFAQQPAGCLLYTLPVVTVQMQPDRNGRPTFENSVDVKVPNDPVLSGVMLYGQWFAVFEQCGFAGCNVDAVATSDGAVIAIGN